MQKAGWKNYRKHNKKLIWPCELKLANKKACKFDLQAFIFLSAVREGFEPSVQFPVRQFSKLILSASQAPHRIVLRWR
jgi:hypothetical protein